MTRTVVSLWTLSPGDDPEQETGALMACLDDTTRERVRSLVRGPDRWARAGAHTLCRLLLCERYGGHPRDWRFETRPGGKPFLPDVVLDFSLSHTRGLCACALLEGPGCIGLDVEPQNRPVNALALARRYFHPGEAGRLSTLDGPERDAAFLDLWTAKEAVVKAPGGGLQEGLGSFQVDLPPGDAPALVEAPARFGPLARWTLMRPHVPGYSAAVAVRREGPVSLVHRHFSGAGALPGTGRDTPPGPGDKTPEGP